MKRKLSALLLSLSLSLTLNAAPAYALTDDNIFTDPITGNYSGREDGAAIAANINSANLPASYWAKEQIARAMALNIIKGGAAGYNPSENVSNAELLTAALRAIKREDAAAALAPAESNRLPAGSPLKDTQTIGYLRQANLDGFITNQQYNNVRADQSALDAARGDFIYGAPVTRQQAAAWIYQAIRLLDPNAFSAGMTQQNTFSFTDAAGIALPNLPAVEALAAAKVMNADASGSFRPDAPVSKGDLAQIFEALGDSYYVPAGITKLSGTVGGIKTSEFQSTGAASGGKQVYVRAGDGKINVLRNFRAAQEGVPEAVADAPVYREDAAGGLALLQEGDRVEYLVAGSQLLYVQVTDTKPVDVRYVTGQLASLVLPAGQITLTGVSGGGEDTSNTYTMIDGLYYNENGKNYIFVNYNQKTQQMNIPLGSALRLRLKGDVVDQIDYLGEPELADDLYGVVIENNPEMGYLTILDKKGGEITKNFYPEDLRVKKKQYYDAVDEIGYISDIFPHFKYNPTECGIDDIEPGDIVFIRNSPDDPDYITSISASTNYIAGYGKIKEITPNDGYYEVLLQYENGQTSWFTVPAGLFVTSRGKPVSLGDVRAGDWARLLVNQAIIGPGRFIESAKEITIESAGHEVTTLLRGQLSGLDPVQNKLLVQNVQQLAKTGWSGYKQSDSFSLTSRDTEYFHNGKQISAEYAQKYFKRADNEVYIALEDAYSGKKVRKVTFRDGRDQLLPSDAVMTAGANGSFSLPSASGEISTDAGSIVVRNGRLVDGRAIMPADYAAVSLNGGATAAVVNITDTPGAGQLILARGRVLSVDDGKSFKVQSMAVLSGDKWMYTPVSREFAVDYNTLFLDSSGPRKTADFLDYTDRSEGGTATTVVDKVYNILVDGGRAAVILDAPYSTKMVRGTVYSVSGDTLYLRDASYRNNATGAWLPVSNNDAAIQVKAHPNSLIGKNNARAALSSIQTGDQIKAYTDKLPQVTGAGGVLVDKVSPGADIDGYIVFAEK
ncbi:MAG: S-layer homology domain-containing protein [Clostridiales bacterium]|jgi:hypothetical protein|nr:S-layer homology domain-containing protein [Clostridiales bacterium]